MSESYCTQLEAKIKHDRCHSHRGCSSCMTDEIVSLRSQLTAALAERNEAREVLRSVKREVGNLRDLFKAASDQEKKLTPGNVGHRGFLSGYLFTGSTLSQKLYDLLKQKLRALPAPERKEG